MTSGAVQVRSRSRSNGVNTYSAASSGDGRGVGRPWRSRTNESELGPASQRACSVGVGADHRDADHRVRPLEVDRRPERLAVHVERGDRVVRREVVRERERQPEHARDLRAVVAGTEHPERGSVAAPGHGGDLRVRALEVREAGRAAARGTRRRRTPPGMRRSAAAVTGSVPGARPMPRSMRPGCSASSMPNCSATTSDEWFGSMTPPAPMRRVDVRRGEVGDEDRRRRARDARHVVVLGDPDPGVAPALRQPGELDGVAQRGGGSRPLADGCEVEHRQHRVGRLGACALVRSRRFSHRGVQRRVRLVSSGCRGHCP